MGIANLLMNLPGMAQSAKLYGLAWACYQRFFFSQNIGLLTPKIIYFYYLNKYFLDQSIQKIFHLNLKTEALLASSVAVLPEILLRAPRRLLLFIIKNIRL